jgi:hypothetical protein
MRLKTKETVEGRKIDKTNAEGSIRRRNGKSKHKERKKKR